MTEKRFVYEVFDIVDFKPEEFKLYEIDNNPADDLDESNLFYVYSTSKANIEHLVERLNELFDENDHLKQQLECHKERIQILSELLDLADMIIDLSDDEKAKESWGNKNRSLELKWKEVLKKYGKGDV